MIDDWVTEEENIEREKFLIALLERKHYVKCYCDNFFTRLDINKNQDLHKKSYLFFKCKKCGASYSYKNAILQIKLRLLNNHTTIRVSEIILLLLSDCKKKAESNNSALIAILLSYIKDHAISSDNALILEKLNQ